MADLEDCPWCDAKASVGERADREVFALRDGAATVELSCDVTVISCSACGCDWTDWRGEQARTAAVDAYLASEGRGHVRE